MLPKFCGISYHIYHKINMRKFYDDLANISFVLSPASTATDLYDQYVHDLRCLLDRDAPLICGIIKEEPAGCLSYTYHKEKSVMCQFGHMWHKDRSELSRTKLGRQIARFKSIY